MAKLSTLSGQAALRRTVAAIGAMSRRQYAARPAALHHRHLLPLASLLISSPALADDGLNLLQTLTGKCFVAEVGSGARDTHCFATVYGGKHIRDTHKVVLQGRVIYRGETTYSSEGGELRFHYINSLGGAGRGSARAISGGIAFVGAMRSDSEAASQPMNSEWRWAGTGYAVADGRGNPVTYSRTGFTGK